jgi:hypothetical protein
MVSNSKFKILAFKMKKSIGSKLFANCHNAICKRNSLEGRRKKDSSQKGVIKADVVSPLLDYLAPPHPPHPRSPAPPAPHPYGH